MKNPRIKKQKTSQMRFLRYLGCFYTYFVLSSGRKLLQLLYAIAVIDNRDLKISVLAAKLVDKVLNIHAVVEIHLIDQLVEAAHICSLSSCESCGASVFFENVVKLSDKSQRLGNGYVKLVSRRALEGYVICADDNTNGEKSEHK